LTDDDVQNDQHLDKEQNKSCAVLPAAAQKFGDAISVSNISGLGGFRPAGIPKQKVLSIKNNLKGMI
jgi:hypothetical protein